ncbi:sensor histidine kinase [Aliarcobacter cibarius]|uniref:histidine kinase n=1 Tax=Aliarcobacter cibarius TaxID=255507 RepID=A0ABY2V584_9BACT|nr:HAMP domain-containing sensor histidine kinase [Aliarcobacter cibarius]QEZ90130.1 two-component system sensor histidine kinase, putative CusS [Aliarcobacter cibarius]TLT00507.1 HAMP domain-containing histidine kinase [Aliarcobacter cibarius]TLT00745.1 HAMP domain-containing histidine kinase [Aliarcobacter cibarius]TLT05216.1 HAMP domain-containing histidine kinase [Aliarcobacter cibarius]
MDIDLTNSEKKSFFSFLGLYLGSSFILMLIALFFYYQNEKTLYIDLAKSNMQNIISKASSEIIVSHMLNGNFNKESYLNNQEYKISFYDKDKNFLFGNLEGDFSFEQNFYNDEEKLIIIDSSTVGHLGIWYIVLKDNSLKEKISNLKLNIVLIFFIFYSIITLIGWSLAKMFLRPIKNERERLNNFIKDTTHELNTPISAIIMSCEGDNLTQKQLDRIKFSAKRVSEIYKDLTYIFLENIEKKNFDKIDLSKIIKQEIISFEPMIARKKLKIDLQLEEFFYEISKDDFIRLFNNLFSNAIKYNKIDGNIDIILKNRELIIKDTGIGVSKDKIKDIFNRYYRGTNQSGGFGLGLNIVNMICKTYNIKIDVESIEDSGTKFILNF